MSVRSICVYCGSQTGGPPEYARAAASLGTAIARDGLTLVYGGGSVGLMGIVADAALAAGGRVIGVIPRILVERELAHRSLAELVKTGSMQERKSKMAELSDAFIALPGGIGTLDELFEMWTWAQLGLHAKPCALINTAGYYDDLVAFLDRAVADGFLRAETRSLLRVVDDLTSPSAFFTA
jgi:uncharacterized protein (TIGR00730 family)